MTIVNKEPGKFLPDDLTGKTVLEVGSWKGKVCIYAVEHGAKEVVAIDAFPRNAIIENANRYGFTYVTCDIGSEKFLHFHQYDIVICAGVLYHVADPFSTLSRLRHACKGSLYLETLAYLDTKAVLKFLDEEGFRPSAWWAPSESCLKKMLICAGFKNIQRHRTAVQPPI